MRGHPLAASAPGQRRKRLAHLPQQHHLAVRVGLGFEQQRIHAHVGLGARGQRLKVLRAADLAHGGLSTRARQSRHHARVVAHVLRLERRDLQAPVGVVAAQRGRHPALARVAAGA